jgi:hypothetical protein
MTSESDKYEDSEKEMRSINNRSAFFSKGESLPGGSQKELLTLKENGPGPNISLSVSRKDDRGFQRSILKR